MRAGCPRSQKSSFLKSQHVRNLMQNRRIKIRFARREQTERLARRRDKGAQNPTHLHSNERERHDPERKNLFDTAARRARQAIQRAKVAGPREAKTVIITASVETSSRHSEPRDKREPTSALKTYSEGKETTRVAKNSTGTLPIEESVCSKAGANSLLVSAKQPMQTP